VGGFHIKIPVTQAGGNSHHQSVRLIPGHPIPLDRNSVLVLNDH
jgi:hypothetical protein